jgi:sec-independent protein translocase protein TatA
MRRVFRFLPRPGLPPSARIAMLPLFALLTPMTAIVLGAVVLLLFGNRIPSLMKNLGQGITEFKKGMKEIEEQHEEEETKVAK